MKLEINVPDVCYENIMNGEMDSLDVRYGLEAIKNGTQLPEGAEILTAEAYSDLCLRASRIPCYLESPCEYQNEDIKIHYEERKTDTCENAGEDYAECDQFVCSKCGIELQDWHSVERDMDDGEVSYHEYTFRFCPNCGRKIVEGAGG